MKAHIKLCTNEPNKKIACIKFYRWLTNNGLKDSKDFIENLQSQYGSLPAEFTVDTELDRETIENYMDECKLGGSATVGNGIEGKFFGISGDVIHLRVSFNKNVMEMDLPIANLGTMIDGFLINSSAAKEISNDTEDPE